MKKYLFLLFLILLISNCIILPPDNEQNKKIYKGTLIITEIGSGYYVNDSRWIEIYNNSTETANLSDWKLRCKSILMISPYTLYSEEIFDLPELLIEPGCYVLIRGKSSDSFVNGSNVVFIANGNRLPFWDQNGFIELKSTIGSDFVRFGSDNTAPSNLVYWSGSNAPSLTYSFSDYGKSIARDKFNTDTNSGLDWIFREFATPGGPNDVTSNEDTDNDGIPDCSEENDNSTFAGLPIYRWGARIGQKDIFIHIDYMDSTDPGVIPRKEALQKVVNVFENHSIKIHFDVGDLFGDTTLDFNLDGRSHKVPFAKGITLGIAPNKANLYEYKNKYMPIAKRQIFYYVVMGYSQNEDGSSGSSGLAEINGNDFIVTLGNWGLNTTTQEDLQLLINWQAATIMHEFGHNLGLRHGGDVDENYKPNYYSIMNYMYQLNGLPQIGNDREGDRYYWYMYKTKGKSEFLQYFPSGYSDLHNNPFSLNFLMDYSNGSGNPIDEVSFSETIGLGRSGSSGVDYNGNGSKTDSLTNWNINEGSTISTLTDYNDWLNINIIFARKYSGNNSGFSRNLNRLYILPDIIEDDKQEVVQETLTRPF